MRLILAVWKYSAGVYFGGQRIPRKNTALYRKCHDMLFLGIASRGCRQQLHCEAQACS